LMSAMATIFFFGGCLPIQYLEWIPGYITLGIKIITISFIFIWVRATFPRIRYDQLMQLIWKSYLPFCIGNVIFIASIYAI
jgi:NADH-quinone oxidoreductase subunit H